MAKWHDHVGMLPTHMQKPMIDWIDYGRPHPDLMGSFMRALFTEPLPIAAKNADEANLSHLRQWATYLWEYAPSGCYGSYQKLIDWQLAGGYEGLKRDEEPDFSAPDSERERQADDWALEAAQDRAADRWDIDE